MKKTNQMKRILSLFLVLVTLISMVSVMAVSASAASPRSVSTSSFFNTTNFVFNTNGGTITTPYKNSNGQITMPRAIKSDKTLLGWTNDRSGKTATYKPGCTYELNWTNSTPFFYAVWGDFVPKNILQVNANKSSKYLSGSWYKLTNGSSYYNIQRAGCGIVSLVSAVYNLSGTIEDAQVGEAIDDVFDWAYKKGYWKNQVVNRKLFANSDNKFGDKYGFTISSEYSGTSTDSRLINHVKNGGTAVVHVYGHFMAIVDYKVENGVGKFLVYDPAPGDGTKYDSLNRDGITSAKGNWLSVKNLKNDGGTKGLRNTKKQRMENIEIDAYWLVSAK